MITRLDWDQYFLVICKAVAFRADCTRRAVGAVLVRSNRSIASTGYNGSPPGGPSCLAGECPRGQSGVAPLSAYDNCHALHAEINCLAFAREDTTGYVMYLTCPPCDWCLKVIKAHRLARVIWPEGTLDLAPTV